MAGILSSYSDSTCNTHNALRNITGYACGVTFSFQSPSSPPPDLRYAVPALQSCCASAPGSPPVLRIPGNAGCEMQFCVVQPAATTRTWTYHQTPTAAAAAVVSTEVTSGPPGDLQSCLAFVYEGDLPEAAGDRVADVGSWCVARMYDTEMPASEVRVAVAAEAAPASWTGAAAVDPSESATATAAAASSSAGRGVGTGGRYDAVRSTGLGVKVWGVALLMTMGLAVAL